LLFVISVIIGVATVAALLVVLFYLEEIKRLN
jgi:hypothetical protein